MSDDSLIKLAYLAYRNIKKKKDYDAGILVVNRTTTVHQVRRSYQNFIIYY
jgi:hypothetical protein